jgi:tetratricopeptide (TPR) repeat protein
LCASCRWASLRRGIFDAKAGTLFGHLIRRLRFSLGEAETALPPLLEALDLTPAEDLVSIAFNRFFLALCYRDLGNQTRAQEEVERIRELLPRLPESMKQLPELLSKLEGLMS